jgi:lysophospholipase L1-like esterase
MPLPPRLCLLLLLALGLHAGAAAAADRWEADIAAFEAADKKSFPAPGGNVFVGSSSIVKWTQIAQDLAPAPIIKRGFGGSLLSDSEHYADRIIIPYKPKRVFVYAGDNDLAASRAPAAVAKSFTDLAEKVHAALPATHVWFITIKPSPSRVALLDAMVKTNGLIRDFAADHPYVSVVDVFTPMLKDGKPRPELFVSDNLHMNADGYKLWTSLIKPLLAD